MPKRQRSPGPPSHGSSLPRSSRPEDRNAEGAASPSNRAVDDLEAEIALLRDQLGAYESVVGRAFLNEPHVMEYRGTQSRTDRASLHDVAASTKLADTVQAAVREAVREKMTEFKSNASKSSCIAIGPAVFADWYFPHAVVPAIVAEDVVAPYVGDQWVVRTPDGEHHVISGMARPADTIAALSEVTECSRVVSALTTSESFQQLVCRVVSTPLSASHLYQASMILERFSKSAVFSFLRDWCLLRGGDEPAGRRLLASGFPVEIPSAFLLSDVGRDEFFSRLVQLIRSEQDVITIVKMLLSFCSRTRSDPLGLFCTALFCEHFYFRLATFATQFIGATHKIHNLILYVVPKDRVACERWRENFFLVSAANIVRVWRAFATINPEKETHQLWRTFCVFIRRARLLSTTAFQAASFRDGFFFQLVQFATSDSIADLCNCFNDIGGFPGASESVDQWGARFFFPLVLRSASAPGWPGAIQLSKALSLLASVPRSVKMIAFRDCFFTPLAKAPTTAIPAITTALADLVACASESCDFEALCTTDFRTGFFHRASNAAKALDCAKERSKLLRAFVASLSGITFRVSAADRMPYSDDEVIQQLIRDCVEQAATDEQVAECLRTAKAKDPQDHPVFQLVVGPPALGE